jgi:hypothetical protein
MSDVEFFVKMRDAGQLIADACNERLEKMAPPGMREEKNAKGVDIDMSRIQWQAAEGSKGPYETADDPSNPEFERLSKIVSEHKGKLRIGPYFVWRFTEGSKIGRKIVEKK